MKKIARISIINFFMIGSFIACNTNQNKMEMLNRLSKFSTKIYNGATLKNAYKACTYTKNGINKGITESKKIYSDPTRYFTNVYHNNEYNNPHHIISNHQVAGTLHKLDNDYNTIENSDEWVNGTIFGSNENPNINEEIDNDDKNLNQDNIQGFQLVGRLLDKGLSYTKNQVVKAFKNLIEEDQHGLSLIGISQGFYDDEEYENEEIEIHTDEINKNKTSNNNIDSDWCLFDADKGYLQTCHKQGWISYLGSKFTNAADLSMQAEKLIESGINYIASNSKEYLTITYKGSIYVIRKLPGSNADLEQFVNSIIVFVKAYIDYKITSVKMAFASYNLIAASLGLIASTAQISINGICHTANGINKIKNYIYGNKNNDNNSFEIENPHNLEELE